MKSDSSAPPTRVGRRAEEAGRKGEESFKRSSHQCPYLCAWVPSLNDASQFFKGPSRGKTGRRTVTSLLKAAVSYFVGNERIFKKGLFH